MRCPCCGVELSFAEGAVWSCLTDTVNRASEVGLVIAAKAAQAGAYFLTIPGWSR